MPVMEGVGDEVLVVVGVFILLCVILLAWVSTHTRDIPFVSVIVVELSQRRQRISNNNNSGQVDGQAVEEETGADTPLAESTPPSEMVSAEETTSANNNAATANADDSAAASATASKNSGLKGPVPPPVAEGSSTKSTDSKPPAPSSESEPNDPQQDSALPEQAEAEGSGSGPVQAEGEDASTIPPFRPWQQESGEEVRRRRVAYYTGGQKSSGVQKDTDADRQKDSADTDSPKDTAGTQKDSADTDSPKDTAGTQKDSADTDSPKDTADTQKDADRQKDAEKNATAAATTATTTTTTTEKLDSAETTWSCPTSTHTAAPSVPLDGPSSSVGASSFVSQSSSQPSSSSFSGRLPHDATASTLPASVSERSSQPSSSSFSGRLPHDARASALPASVSERSSQPSSSSFSGRLPHTHPSHATASALPASVSERSSPGEKTSKVTRGESPSRRPEAGASAPGEERERVQNDLEETADTAGQQIRVRLKYLNDTQRLVYAHPHETVGNFRRLHFSSELEEDKVVRFIFNGQDLRNDLSTLQACNINDNSVVHCLITQNQRHSSDEAQSSSARGRGSQDDDIQMGAMLFPVFGVILGLVWYLRFTYRQYFNAMSTISLAGISFIYLLAFVSSVRHRRQPHRAHLE